MGGGAVGTLVARRLIREKNEVVIIEADEDRCFQLEESLDAKIVHGNARSIPTLEKAGLLTADMLIAVTSSDEVNILGCLIAQAFSNIRIKVARLRTHEVERWRSICKSKLLGIDLVIHPDSESAERIMEVVGLPGVSDLLRFADGRVRLFGMILDEDCWLAGKAVADLDSGGDAPRALIAMIFRGSRVIVPRGDDRLQIGDHIFIVVPEKELDRVFEFVGVKKVDRVQRVFVVGGKQLGIETALRLEKSGVQVKLFDKDLDRCQIISTLVTNTVVVHADGTDQEILEEENIEGIDAYLAMTGNDEVNIIASLLSKRLGARKAVALVNRIDFLPMAQLLGINSTFSTRLVVVDRILQFVRKGHVLSVTTFREEEAEAIELVAVSSARCVGRALKDAKLPRGSIVGAIVRPTGEVVVPDGETVIEVDDRVIIFCLEHLVPTVEKAFY